MGKAGARTRLGRNDWVLAALRALAQGGIHAVKVEALARDLETTKGSFYWHFKDLSDLHDVMLELWQDVATTRLSAAVRDSGLDGRGQLLLLADMVSVRPAETVGGPGVEPALRDWARTDPKARAVAERVDRQRLSDLQDFLSRAGVTTEHLAANAHLFYAAVIGFENLRLTTGADMRGALRDLVELMVPKA